MNEEVQSFIGAQLLNHKTQESDITYVNCNKECISESEFFNSIAKLTHTTEG